MSLGATRQRTVLVRRVDTAAGTSANGDDDDDASQEATVAELCREPCVRHAGYFAVLRIVLDAIAGAAPSPSVARIAAAGGNASVALRFTRAAYLRCVNANAIAATGNEEDDQLTPSKSLPGLGPPAPTASRFTQLVLRRKHQDCTPFARCRCSTCARS